MNGKVKVSLGSGTTVAPSWINIDKSLNIYLSKWPFLGNILYRLKLISKSTFEENWRGKKIIRRDITRGLGFRTCSVDIVYCSHVLEHLTRWQARKVCENVYDILKTNGLFRVVVPDLKLLAQKYLEGDKGFFGAGRESRETVSDLFMKNLGLVCLQRRPFFERIFDVSSHKWMYDFESLAHLLRLSGFRDIRKLTYRKGSCPDLQIIEKRKKSIYIESYKH